MMNKENYVAMLKNGFNVNAVKAQVKNDAKDDITEMMFEMFEDDENALYEFLNDNDLAEGIHPMDELDDVFDYMSPTEVLEELSDMDLSDNWFDEYSKETSRYLDELWSESFEDLARKAVDDDINLDDDDIEDVLENMNEILEELEVYSKRIEWKRTQAQLMFEEALKDDKNIDTLLNVLWTMND